MIAAEEAMNYDIDYKEIYNLSPDMCLSGEAGTGRIVECNQTLLDMLGYSKKEVLAKTVIEMYHPDDVRIGQNLRHYPASKRMPLL